MRILTTTTFPQSLGDRLLPETSPQSSCTGLVTWHQDGHPRLRTRPIPQKMRSQQHLQGSPNQGEGPWMVLVSEAEHSSSKNCPVRV